MSIMITILGPTASGKTQLAVAVADQLDGEIISADSRQVYRQMNIGTGKDLDEYQVNDTTVPYHLIDIADPGEEYNIYQFQHDFMEAYRDIIGRKKIPILCGGSGLYLDAVLSDYALLEAPENRSLRASLDKKPMKDLIAMLEALKVLHNTTDTKDRLRLIRAIEIAQFERDHSINKKFPTIRHLVFGIRFARDEIKERITLRLKKRVEGGLFEEVQQLLDQGITSEKLKYYGLEYKFVTMYLTGEINYNDFFQKLNSAIHQFAKRQMTWFRRMEKRGINIHWLEGSLPLSEKVEKIRSIIASNEF